MQLKGVQSMQSQKKKKKDKRTSYLWICPLPIVCSQHPSVDPFDWIKMFALISRLYLNGSIHVNVRWQYKEIANLSSKIIHFHLNWESHLKCERQNVSLQRERWCSYIWQENFKCQMITWTLDINIIHLFE